MTKFEVSGTGILVAFTCAGVMLPLLLVKMAVMVIDVFQNVSIMSLNNYYYSYSSVNRSLVLIYTPDSKRSLT